MPCYITQLVRPSADMSIEFNSDTVEAHDMFGNTVCTFNRSKTLTTNISFEAVMSPKHNNLCTIQIEEN